MHNRPSVLVPVRVLEGESIPEGTPELLANAHVVLLGYHVIPEQTATGQARLQFEDRAMGRLEEFAANLEEAGATVEVRLVFTHEGQKTIDRMIAEHDCLAVLVPHAANPPERILVAVRSRIGTDRLVAIVGGLFGSTEIRVTLFQVVPAEDAKAEKEAWLGELAGRLSSAGMERDAIDTEVVRDEHPQLAIATAADEFDAIVMGETDPSLVTFVFGMQRHQVAKRFLRPVLIVQRERPEDHSDTA